MVHFIDNRNIYEIPFKDIKIGDFFSDGCDNIFVKTNNDNGEENSFCFNQNCNLRMYDTDYFRMLNVTVEISYMGEEDV